MPEYIEREALINWAKEFYPNDKHFVSGIMNAPTADVVEVIRCKNCKKYELMKSGNTHFCNEFGGRVTEEDFCSRAQKMDGGNNNG